MTLTTLDWVFTGLLFIWLYFIGKSLIKSKPREKGHNSAQSFPTGIPHGARHILYGKKYEWDAHSGSWKLIGECDGEGVRGGQGD